MSKSVICLNKTQITLKAFWRKNISVIDRKSHEMDIKIQKNELFFALDLNIRILKKIKITTYYIKNMLYITDYCKTWYVVVIATFVVLFDKVLQRKSK